jgi:hypothetical protein
VAWRPFWRRCRVEHRKHSIFETFPRVEVGKVGGLCRDLHSVGAAKQPVASRVRAPLAKCQRPRSGPGRLQSQDVPERRD